MCTGKSRENIAEGTNVMLSQWTLTLNCKTKHTQKKKKKKKQQENPHLAPQSRLNSNPAACYTSTLYPHLSTPSSHHYSNLSYNPITTSPPWSHYYSSTPHFLAFLFPSPQHHQHLPSSCAYATNATLFTLWECAWRE
jgi:hypothetical protein